MPIPDFQKVLLPFLRSLEDEKEHSLREVIEILSDQLGLSEEEERTLLPSGKQAVFDNRVGWARTYLNKAKLIESTRRGYSCITERGLSVLRQNPQGIDIKFLNQFNEFKEFHEGKKGKTPEIIKDQPEITPEETLENAYEQLNENLADDLLQQLKASLPRKFEQIVVDFLIGMGYGGSKKEATKVIGKPGDEGIDGIINEDLLGLDVIYIQAKKWEGNVGRPEVHKFAGALLGQHAKKGIFITTSGFTQDAIDFASKVDSKIILIDGKTLVKHMIEKNVGVATSAKYEVKKIDLDYFTEE